MSKGRRRRWFVAHGVLALRLLRRKRRRSHSVWRLDRTRRSAEEIIEASVNDGLFAREYRMHLGTFNEIAAILDDSLSPKTKSRADGIGTKSKLLMTLRYIAK